MPKPNPNPEPKADAHPEPRRQHQRGSPDTDRVIDSEFAALARRWRGETLNESSPIRAAEHPSMRAIVGMGRPVVPLILRELRDHGGAWFLALRELTGEDPVPPADRGRVRAMTEAWLTWGRDRGLLQDRAARTS